MAAALLATILSLRLPKGQKERATPDERRPSSPTPQAGGFLIGRLVLGTLALCTLLGAGAAWSVTRRGAFVHACRPGILSRLVGRALALFAALDAGSTLVAGK